MSEATIWARLRAKGFSETAVAAIMGNMQDESGLLPYRLQGDFNWKEGYPSSKSYTADVDTGRISKDDFLYRGPGGGGYGLCQWTFWSRKEGLYNLSKSRGVSIADEQTQIDWFYQEVQKPEYVYIKNNYERYTVFDFLHRDESLLEMTKAVLRGYEKPADQSDATAVHRAGYGKEIFDRNSGSVTPAPDPAPEPAPDPTPTPTPGDSCEITVPVLSFGEKSVAVAMMQRGLQKNKIGVGLTGADGDFGKNTLKAVKEFQNRCNLEADGVVGHDTWQVLFQ